MRIFVTIVALLALIGTVKAWRDKRRGTWAAIFFHLPDQPTDIEEILLGDAIVRTVFNGFAAIVAIYLWLHP